MICPVQNNVLILHSCSLTGHSQCKACSQGDCMWWWRGWRNACGLEVCPHSTPSSNTRPEKHSPKRQCFPTRPLFSYFAPEIIWKIKAKKCYPTSLEHAWYLSITRKMMGYHCWKVRHGSSYLTTDMIGSSPSSKELASEKERAGINFWLSYWANELEPW